LGLADPRRSFSPPACPRFGPTLAEDGSFARKDERVSTADEPTHDDLCEREQRFLLKAIDWDQDLTDHMNDAVKSLAIVLAADQSVRTGAVVTL